MKLRIRASFLVIILMTVIINVIFLMLLHRAPGTNVTLVIRSDNYPADERDGYWKGDEETYLNLLHHMPYTSRDNKKVQTLGIWDRSNSLLMVGGNKSCILANVQKIGMTNANLTIIAVISMTVIFLIVLSYIAGPIITVTRKEGIKKPDEGSSYLKIE